MHTSLPHHSITQSRDLMSKISARVGISVKDLLFAVGIQLPELLLPKPPARLSLANNVWVETVTYSLAQEPPAMEYPLSSDVCSEYMISPYNVAMIASSLP